MKLSVIKDAHPNIRTRWAEVWHKVTLIAPSEWLLVTCESEDEAMHLHRAAYQRRKYEVRKRGLQISIRIKRQPLREVK